MILERPDSLGSFATIRANQLSTGAWGSAPYGVPNTGYVWDSKLGLWVPMPGSAAGIIEAFSALIAANTGNLGTIADSQDTNLAAIGNSLTSILGLVNRRVGANEWPYLWASLLGAVQGLGFRKVLAVDAGAYTPVAAGATTISYTGINLNGRTAGVVWNRTDGTLHKILTITDPAGAPGVITLETPIATATAMLLVPFTSVPHAYATTTDSLRVTNIAPEWAHYVEPTIFISQTSQPADATYQFGPLPCLDYGFVYFQIDWAVVAPGTRTCVFNVYGKLDNAVWPGAGTINAAHLFNSWTQATPGGSAFGAPPVTTGRIVGRIQDAAMFDSIMVEMITAATSAHNTAVTAYYGLAGRGR